MGYSYIHLISHSLKFALVIKWTIINLNIIFMKNNSKQAWTIRCLLSVALMFFFSVGMFAQSITVKGVVKDVTGDPIIGASVLEKGTSNGTITDFNGNFELMNVRQGADIEISFVGFANQVVKAQSSLNIVLKEDAETLDEVVVVGYGVQKKSVVTASIAKVSADDLAYTAPVRMDNALKGLAAGVTVTSSSGQPGAAARVRIRGIGTINNSDPLYIVDGMPIDGGLDYLNPNDIESIEVLKDAASGAVYGARAANGVVLVTTKKGKEGKARVTYDFSYGISSPWTERDVLNATEYAIMMNEGALNAGMAPKYNDPYSYGVGTNWQKETFNYDAPTVSHQVSVSGGSDKLNYLLSLGYYDQEGIVGGNYGRSNYERLTMRSNTAYQVWDAKKERNFLNSLKITSNISYARVKSTGIDTNSQWGSPLGSALALSPILTPYLEGQAAQDQLDYYSSFEGFVPMYSPDGKLYTLAGADYNEMVNPLASLSLPASKGWSHKFVANWSAELQLWDNLRFKTSYGVDLSFWGNDGYTVEYYLTANNKSDKSVASSSSERGTTWQIENVLMYDKEIDKHSFSVVLGQSAKKGNMGMYLGGSRYYIKNLQNPWIDASSGLQENGEMSVYGGKKDVNTLASLFGRISYNYDERYMFEATVRRDGSSRFGANNRYAVFPSFSLGWNLTNEKFMQERPEWLTATKVRMSWGKNGNENIGNFMYTVLTATGNNYLFGLDGAMVNGVKASGLANPDLKWEESEQFNVGLDFGFLNNALTFTADYYKKTTNGMLMTMNIPSYVGESKPWGNVGIMENSGFEFEANYKFRISDFNFRIGGNLTYLKNELVEYGNESGWANLDSFQGAGTISRAENGKPFPFFYGYKTDGVFQNMNEVKAYTDANGNMIQPSAVPGDVRFVDVDGDGQITDADKTDIGKGMPDWTFGINFNASWKGFDFSMMWQGTMGNDVFDATRRTDISAVNLPSWMLGRWTGEGTSNKYPRFALGDNVNWQSSDLYVHDGSYLRLKNIQLGYTLPQSITRKAFIENLRVYVAAENLLTFTKYHGFDPEISSGGTSLGIDYGVYPQSRTWTVGVNVAF